MGNMKFVECIVWSISGDAEFSLKLQFFNFKMPADITISSHINNLRYILKQLAEFKAVIDVTDTKFALLNSQPSKYNSIICEPMQDIPKGH